MNTPAYQPSSVPRSENAGLSVSGPDMPEEASDLQFQIEPFLRVCRCAQCGLDLPLVFYNALSLCDAGQGGNSYELFFRFQSLCREWLDLKRGCGYLFQNLSQFGECLSSVCRNAAAAIRTLPMGRQCTAGVLSPDIHQTLLRLRAQVGYHVRCSRRFLDDVDSIRIRVDNEIHPHAALFRQLAEAQPPLVIDTQWGHIRIEHCGFLAQNPAVAGVIRDLKAARTAGEAACGQAGLQRVAEELWTQVQDALTSVGGLDEALVQTSADIRSLNALWLSMELYLENIERLLSGAMDSSRLVSVRTRLESCAGQWMSIAGASRDIARQLAGADDNAAACNKS